MSEELKPCPFCGGEEIYGKSEASGRVRAVCFDCLASTGWLAGADEAAAAWNRRAERTCRMVRARWDDGECVWGCRCTACGDRFTYETGTTWRYCPACGAKVVE